MNAYLLQNLARDHIKESRQQAAAARKSGAAHDTRGAGSHARRAAHRLIRGAGAQLHEPAAARR